MVRSYGLYTHIRNNQVRSVILLAGFVVLLQALLFSLLLIFHALGGSMDGRASVADFVAAAADSYRRLWLLAMLAALAWFGIAYFANSALTSFATGARPVSREEAPKLYNALENLCISRGLAMPRLQIIDDPALNAFASGLTERQQAITVTRGLMNALTPAEMEAVLAHELTHIRNKDTQLLVIAVIFAGVFAFFGDLVIRGWDFPYGFPPRHRRSEPAGDEAAGQGERERGGRGGGAALIAILIAIAIIVVTYGVSTLIRFALSRSREYLADAGAVELTMDPDAMIRALRRIEGHAGLEVPSRMEAFFIENPVGERITGWLATHPSIADRVAALERYAGGRDAVDPAAAKGA